jgi:hypothetical protein
MLNFKELNKLEYLNVWDQFYHLFHFKPSVNQFPAIISDLPQLKFDIKDCFVPSYNVKKLEEYAINIFKKISKKNEKFYALDWQHNCYEFNPRLLIDRNEFDEWIIPVLPNGDYFIFMTKDFRNLWFGHPWEQTITLIGFDIVKEAQISNDKFPNLTTCF